MNVQRKRDEYQEVISIEEYLEKRKVIREQENKKNSVPNGEFLIYQTGLCQALRLF